MENALSGLTNAQLAEHYKECIRLSVENKINKKNAFELHLIDYMAETIRHYGSNLNFQITSCALDASAKIYGFRVDVLGDDTFKLASNLGKIHRETAENDIADYPEAQVLPVHRKLKNKQKKSEKVEINLKNITLDKLKPRFEWELFGMIFSAGFDERGVTALHLFNLQMTDESYRLAFDPAAKHPSLESARALENDTKLDISSFKPIFLKIVEDKPTVDLAFERFEFNDSEMSVRSDLENSPKANCNVNEKYRFNEDFVVEDEEEIHEFGNGLDESYPDDMEHDLYSGQPGDGSGQLSNTIRFLSMRPSEYSYFDRKIKSAWAGPNHWRFLPSTRYQATIKRARRRRLSVQPRADFDKDPSTLIHYEARNLISRSVIQNWSRRTHSLPLDHHYQIENLGRSMLMPFYWIRAVIKGPQPVNGDVGDMNSMYNYSNAVDRSYFCGGNEDQNAQPGLVPDIVGVFQCAQDIEIGEPVAFRGENLVQQPFEIDKPYIMYEKVAKKIDVTAIKQAMWKILTKSKNATSMEDSLMFSELYREIPKHVSNATLNVLSLPIALVIFLQLCNEKFLALKRQEDLADFKIEQG